MKVTILFMTMGEVTTMKALDNLKQYTHPDHDLVIWNNGYKGNMVDMFKLYTDNVFNCTKNQGLVEVLGYTMFISHNDYIVITTADTMLEEGWLDVILEPFADEKVGIVADYQYDTDSAVECTENDLPEGVDCYRKTMIDDIGGLCPSFKLWGVSQTELKLRALEKGWKVIGVKQPSGILTGKGEGKDTLSDNDLAINYFRNNIIMKIIGRMNYDYKWWRTDILDLAVEEDYIINLNEVH